MIRENVEKRFFVFLCSRSTEENEGRNMATLRRGALNIDAKLANHTLLSTPWPSVRHCEQ